jgi:hypothetical protein
VGGWVEVRAAELEGKANLAWRRPGGEKEDGQCATIACHAGGANNVIPDHTLQKAAIEQFLDGGFNVRARVGTDVPRGGAT